MLIELRRWLYLQNWVEVQAILGGGTYLVLVEKNGTPLERIYAVGHDQVLTCTYLHVLLTDEVESILKEHLAVNSEH